MSIGAGKSRGVVYVDICCRVRRQKEEMTCETKDRVEGTERVERRSANAGGGRESAREERKENHETIGGAEAAAFHVAWHRLPLKSLLLFVSSLKIMIVCPRDLLLEGSPDTPLLRCVCVRVCMRVCARRPPKGGTAIFS